MQSYGSEFFPLLLVFLLALVSPGADFFLVLRQAAIYGRKAALMTSLGIGAGLIVHVSYTILGLGLIIAGSVFLFNIIKWAGVAYLIFIGINALMSKGSTIPALSQQKSRLLVGQSCRRAFMLGVGVNLLNPKAALFFLSIFSSFVAPTTASTVQFIYGFVLIVTAVSWFIFLSFFMTTQHVSRVFARLSKWIDRFAGIVFIGFGIRLMFQKIS